jgi:hypothetical protein
LLDRRDVAIVLVRGGEKKVGEISFGANDIDVLTRRRLSDGGAQKGAEQTKTQRRTQTGQ